MNAPLSSAPVAASAPTVKAGQIYILGRLLAIRKAGQSFLHLVIMPAPDAYSSPSTVEVIAKSRLGEKDQDIRILCRIAGFKRSYKTTDSETGEQRTQMTADNKLYAIED